MQVIELIELLSKLNPDADIDICDSESGLPDDKELYCSYNRQPKTIHDNDYIRMLTDGSSYPIVFLEIG